MADPDKLLDKLLEDVVRAITLSRFANSRDDYRRSLNEVIVAFTLLDEHLREGGELPADWAVRREEPARARPASHREATRQLVNDIVTAGYIAKQRLLSHDTTTNTEKYPDRDGGD